MNESKKKKTVNTPADIPATDPETRPAKVAPQKAEGAAKATVRKKPTTDKEVKKVQPRKFKTHSEKKEFNNKQEAKNKK
jgi:hypothetical protein